MRTAVLLAITLTACGRESTVDLADCAGGAPIGPEASHSLEIRANGHVRIDGVGHVDGNEVDATLERLMHTMHNDSEKAAQTGWVYVVDEPLLVRVDASTEFGTAAHWLSEVDRKHLYVTWLAVDDLATRGERCLVVEREPPRGSVNVAYDPDWASKLGPPKVALTLYAADRATWMREPVLAPVWTVDQWTPRGDTPNFTMHSWDEVRAKLLATPDEDRHFWICAALPKSTPWSEIAPIVAEARSRWNAEVAFGSGGAP